MCIVEWDEKWSETNKYGFVGRAIAKAISRRLLTVAGRVPSQARPCGICGERCGTGACFLRVFLFPLTILIPPKLHTHLSSEADPIGALMGDVPCGLSLTPFHEIKKSKDLERGGRDIFQCTIPNSPEKKKKKRKIPVKTVRNLAKY
jgi:hypothetical protein